LTERVVSFAANGRLTGILSEASPDRARPGAPAALMCNVGINHHVGPYRVFVDLARELARRGFPSLRFDFSGRGDSEIQRGGGGSEIERALDDLREGMALLEKRGVATRFVPIGFCSSVDSAHELAIHEERVAGACFVEGYMYRTRGFYLRYPLRFASRARWRRVVAKHLPEVLRDVRPLRHLGRIDLALEDDDVVYLREYPPREKFAGEIDAVARRGAPILFVYVGGDSNINHARQMGRIIGRGHEDGFEIAYYPEADHVFFRVDERRVLIERIGDWASRSFPG
jgi:hypothetical protein